jgi:hypothetical protein
MFAGVGGESVCVCVCVCGAELVQQPPHLGVINISMLVEALNSFWHVTGRSKNALRRADYQSVKGGN